MDVPVNRRQLVQWLMTFHPESVEELRDCLLRRLDDGAFAPSPNPIFNKGEMERAVPRETGDFVKVPWTDDQVESLNAYQKCRHWHPYTCGTDGCHDKGGRPGATVLRATREGWVCDVCGKWHQDWAHGWTANWEWRDILKKMIKADPNLKMIYGEGC